MVVYDVGWIIKGRKGEGKILVKRFCFGSIVFVHV